MYFTICAICMFIHSLHGNISNLQSHVVAVIEPLFLITSSLISVKLVFVSAMGTIMWLCYNVALYLYICRYYAGLYHRTNLMWFSEMYLKYFLKTVGLHCLEKWRTADDVWSTLCIFTLYINSRWLFETKRSHL